MGQGLYLPGDSDSKESACNVGDLVSSLDWEDSLEKGMATHSSVLAWKIHGHRWATQVVGYSPWGCKELDTTERLVLSLFFSAFP